MPRKCAITHKSFQTGNSVSHAHNKVRKRFLANIQKTSRYSEILDTRIRFKATPKGLKTIERYGGIDAWLMHTKSSRLDASLRPWKNRLQKAHALRTQNDTQDSNAHTNAPKENPEERATTSPPPTLDTSQTQPS